MINVQEVSKVYPTRFGEKLVLDRISFDLAKGEKLGVLGRNGAGKSTLVRLISGAEKPSSGKIQSSMSISWPLAFGGAFQGNLTGVDNVRFISRLYRQDFEKNLEFVEDFAELGPYLREEVRTYSSGMRARLAFAISMIIEFDCFLIDEVGAVGDARFHARCNLELFEKRGDRAMVIISHDASYVRDHCTRFGVLHDGRLEQFSDFDVAYSEFRIKIGLNAPKGPAKATLVPENRKQLIETTHTVAVRDDAFLMLAREADWQRDAKNWEKGESLYLDALALYPYQRSYWGQKAHCAKELGALVRAEAAYRTACALGEPYSELKRFVEPVMKKQEVSPKDFPVYAYSGAKPWDHPPGIPDIDLFALALWGEAIPDDNEVLRLLRQHRTCDALLADMIADSRFVKAAGQSAPLAPADQTNVLSAEKKSFQKSWARNLVIISQPRKSASIDVPSIIKNVEESRNPWAILMEAQGFAHWPLTQAALQLRNG